MSRLVRLLPLLFVCSLAPAALAQTTNLVLNGVGSTPSPTPYELSMTFPITITNNGPNAAKDVQLKFTIPPGAGFQSVGSSLLPCTPLTSGQTGDVVCATPSLGVTGQPVVVVVVVQFPWTSPGTSFTFNTTLTSSNAQQSPQTVSTTVTIPVRANLELTAATAPATAYIGATYDSVFTIANHGPGPALQTNVSARFSSAFLRGAITAPAGWTCDSPGEGVRYAGCSIDSFPVGATATFSVHGYGDGVATTQLQFGAGCSNAPLEDLDVGATTYTKTQMPPQTDLSVSISAAPAVVHTRDLQTYTIQITNTGSSAAIYPQLQGQLPGVMVSSSTGLSAPSWADLALDPGAMKTITVVIRADATTAGPLNATATVTAANVAGPRTATTSTSSIGPRVDDLQATLTVPDSLHPSVPAVWTFGFVNNGPDATNGWDASITVAGNISTVTPSDPGVTCSIDASIAHCTGGDIASGGRMTARITAVPYQYFQPVNASVAVFNPDTDPNLANNSLTLATPPAALGPDLSVEMKAAATTIADGTTDDLTINVLNIGSDTMDGVTVVVPLAPSFTLVAAPQSCTGTTTVTCHLFDSPPGYLWQIPLTVRPIGTGTFNATATVTSTSAGPELRSDNNTGSATITVLAEGARRRAARH